MDSQMTAMAGEFLTAGKLFKRGCQVSVTYGNAKSVDLLVLNPKTKKVFKVQVKTQLRKNAFFLSREALEDVDVVVFVRLNADDADEQFFIIPSAVMLANRDHFFGSSYRNPAKPAKVPGINYGPLAEYEDRWDVFVT